MRVNTDDPIRDLARVRRMLVQERRHVADALAADEAPHSAADPLSRSLKTIQDLIDAVDEAIRDEDDLRETSRGFTFGRFFS